MLCLLGGQEAPFKLKLLNCCGGTWTGGLAARSCACCTGGVGDFLLTIAGLGLLGVPCCCLLCCRNFALLFLNHTWAIKGEIMSNLR